MFWLVSQILGWVFLSALAGGLIGWALKSRKCVRDTQELRENLSKVYGDKSIIRSDDYIASGGFDNITNSSLIDTEKYSILLNQLEAEKEEVAGLKVKLSLASATEHVEHKHVFAGMSAYDDKSDRSINDGQLTWRNRYLESRVRFLENKVSDLESVSTDLTHSSKIHSEPSFQDVDSSNLVSLGEESIFSNELDSFNLETSHEAVSIKTDEYTNQNVEHQVKTAGGIRESEDKLVDLQSLIWRNRYLEGRVRYLEEDLLGYEIGSSNEVGATFSSKVTDFNKSNLAPDLTFEEETTVEPSVHGTDSDAELERLRWRAKYLEKRVGFLDENLTELELRFQKKSIGSVLETIEKPNENTETSNRDRSEWRNEYLEEKLRFVQQTDNRVEMSPDTNSVIQPQPPLVLTAFKERIQWREIYLNERIRYGEESLSVNCLKRNTAQEYITDVDADRLRWRSRYLEERLRYAQNELKENKVTKIRVRSSLVDNAEGLTKFYREKLDTDLLRLQWREKYQQALNESLTSQHEELLALRASETKFENSDGLEINRLEWKNRYLRSRVKYLEESIKTSNQNAQQLSEKLRHLRYNVSQVDDYDPVYGDESETARLKWRNSYLMGRIGYLEEGKSDQSFVQSEPNEKPGDALDNIDSLSEFRTSRSFVGREQNDTTESEISLNLTSEVSSKREEKSKKKRSTSPRKRSERKSRKTTSKSTKTQVIETKSKADEFQENFRASEYFVEGNATTGRPAYLTQPILGTQDDLREIAGVGPKIETILHDLGIFHFYQIAAWTRKEVEWVDNYLTFKGRIDRENWIDQSKKLARGEETDGQRKYRARKHV